MAEISDEVYEEELRLIWKVECQKTFPEKK